MAVPVVLLSKLRHEPSATRLLALKAMLLNAGGLAEHAAEDDRRRMGRVQSELPATKKIPAATWHTFRVRPANHPARRVAGRAHLVDRYLDFGLETGLEDRLAAGRPSNLIEG